MRATGAGGVLAFAAAAVGWLAAAGFPADAAELHLLEVTRDPDDRSRFKLVAETRLDADAQAIFDVLVDYEDGAFGRISSVYKESDYLAPAPDGTPIVYTRMEGCIWVFCKSLTRVELLETEEPHVIRTTALPERSDFEFAESEWVLTPVDGGTEVVYRLVIDPDFWLPPFVGPAILKKELRDGGERALYRIERLARGLPSGLRPARGAAEEVASVE